MSEIYDLMTVLRRLQSSRRVFGIATSESRTGGGIIVATRKPSVELGIGWASDVEDDSMGRRPDALRNVRALRAALHLVAQA